LVNIGSFGNAELANSEQEAITTSSIVEVISNININDMAARARKYLFFLKY
jgi:hypothetical protein